MLFKFLFKGLGTQDVWKGCAQTRIPFQSSMHATTDAPTRSVCTKSLNTYQICMYYRLSQTYG